MPLAETTPAALTNPLLKYSLATRPPFLSVSVLAALIGIAGAPYGGLASGSIVVQGRHGFAQSCCGAAAAQARDQDDDCRGFGARPAVISGNAYIRVPVTLFDLHQRPGSLAVENASWGFASIRMTGGSHDSAESDRSA